jgi:ATP-dependent exoDNAse (exonuclease V) alpha subunit
MRHAIVVISGGAGTGKVIQTSNDYGLGIMNGTIGIVSEIETAGGTKYIVDFDGDGRRTIQDDQILNLQLAYPIAATWLSA